MGFQTPQYTLDDYLARTVSGAIQLPDFQRGYKWDDERIRQLLVTILRGHPMGVVMLLDTNNDEVRFKPRPVEGVRLDADISPTHLLLDGQQRLTSLTQALTNDGVVETKDSRGKLMSLRYFVNISKALDGEGSMDEAVISVGEDGRIWTNFKRDVELDLSTPDLQREQGYFPLNLLFQPVESQGWILKYAMIDQKLAGRFHAEVLTPAARYSIPAIELDRNTSKSAVATVFEKVNTGGLELNVFELLTATFAGDADYYAEHGTDFRLNDDWRETRAVFESQPVLQEVSSTDFLRAVTLLATRRKHLTDIRTRPTAVSARNEDALRLSLSEYLQWRDPLREAFLWAAGFLADRHIFDTRFLPYGTHLIPLAVIKVIVGADADLRGPRSRIVQWFWCGILGELYGGTTDTRFVRDVMLVPDWARAVDGARVPTTVQDAQFVESRLHSLRTRNAAAYKGIYALLLENQARDWMEDKRLDLVQHRELAVDIHHIFPKKWCADHNIDDEHRESIVNKTAISAKTNRSIGARAPSHYLDLIERNAQITTDQVDEVLDSHCIKHSLLRNDNFDGFFSDRREKLLGLVESAMQKPAQRDVSQGYFVEGSSQFEEAEVAESADESVDDSIPGAVPDAALVSVNEH